MGRITPALFLGWAAFAMARGVGIPAWIDWPTASVPADSTDIAVLVVLTVLCWPTANPKGDDRG